MSSLKKQCKSPGCPFVACFQREGLCYRHKYGRKPTGAIEIKKPEVKK
jgi:hypothetical protein